MVGGYVHSLRFNYLRHRRAASATRWWSAKVEDQNIDWLERPLTPNGGSAVEPAGVG